MPWAGAHMAGDATITSVPLKSSPALTPTPTAGWPTAMNTPATNGPLT